MHINEIRYLSDDDLREVFEECTKYIFERDIKIPLSEDDVWKYIQSVDMIEAIDIEDAAVARRDHLSATHLVDMDEKGYIIADETCATSVCGIYAAGDVRTKQLRQIITAASDGANAVTSIEQYLLTV